MYLGNIKNSLNLEGMKYTFKTFWSLDHRDSENTVGQNMHTPMCKE